MTLPHLVLVQVDYATGEVDRLRIARPASSDTKLFIGMYARSCAMPPPLSCSAIDVCCCAGNLPREYQREHLEAMLKKFKPKVLPCVCPTLMSPPSCFSCRL